MKIYPDMSCSIAVRAIHDLNKDKKDFVIAMRNCSEGRLENEGFRAVAYSSHAVSDLKMPDGFVRNNKYEDTLTCKIYGGEFSIEIRDITRDDVCWTRVNAEKRFKKTGLNFDFVIAPGMSKQQIIDTVSRLKTAKATTGTGCGCSAVSKR